MHQGGPDKEIVARIFVCPTDDVAVARTVAKMAIAGYMTVPVYRAFHEWLGRSEALGPMWKYWAEGDRKSATASIPDEVADALVVHGTPEQIKAHVQRYVDNGVTTPAIAPAAGAGPGSGRRGRAGPGTGTQRLIHRWSVAHVAGEEILSGLPPHENTG